MYHMVVLRCSFLCIRNKPKTVELQQQIGQQLNLRTVCKGKLSPMLGSSVDETSKDRGPRAALMALHLCDRSESERKAWLEESRVLAVVDSCKLSMASVRSGVKCYLEFAGLCPCSRAV